MLLKFLLILLLHEMTLFTWGKPTYLLRLSINVTNSVNPSQSQIYGHFGVPTLSCIDYFHSTYFIVLIHIYIPHSSLWVL